MQNAEMQWWIDFWKGIRACYVDVPLCEIVLSEYSLCQQLFVEITNSADAFKIDVGVLLINYVCLRQPWKQVQDIFTQIVVWPWGFYA